MLHRPKLRVGGCTCLEHLTERAKRFCPSEASEFGRAGRRMERVAALFRRTRSSENCSRSLGSNLKSNSPDCGAGGGGAFECSALDFLHPGTHQRSRKALARTLADDGAIDHGTAVAAVINGPLLVTGDEALKALDARDKFVLDDDHRLTATRASTGPKIRPPAKVPRYPA